MCPHVSMFMYLHAHVGMYEGMCAGIRSVDEHTLVLVIKPDVCQQIKH